MLVWDEEAGKMVETGWSEETGYIGTPEERARGYVPTPVVSNGAKPAAGDDLDEDKARQVEEHPYQPIYQPIYEPSYQPSMPVVYSPPPAPVTQPVMTNGVKAVVPQAGDQVALTVSNGTLGPTHADVLPQAQLEVNGVIISGPGVPEPPKAMVSKQWHVKFESQKYGTFQMFYWLLIDGRMMSYHSPTKTWKIWRPKKHIVISRDPRVSTLRKLGKLNKKVERMLRPFQPKGRGFPAKALATTYLSTAEKKALRA
jgi:hypothetical protein